MALQSDRLISNVRNRRSGFVVAALVLATSLAACGNKNKEATASQTAAKVNKEEITVHQINNVLAQQRALPPAQAASAGKQVLERLIDQELAVQKATDQKLDRDPRVVQQMEAARREIIARAYLEKIGQGAPKPTPQEIKAYYDAHPALFNQRRVYTFQEIGIEVPQDQVQAVRDKLEASKDLPAFVEYLKSSGYRYAVNAVVRGAEQLPLANLDRFAKMKDGQSFFTPTQSGAVVLYLAGSRSQPVDEARAAPAIEQFLLNERRRKVIADDLRALRRAAKIEYVGAYALDPAAAASAAAPPPAPEPPPVTSLTPSLPPAASAAPQLEIEPMSSSAASMPSSSVLDKGLQGMK